MNRNLVYSLESLRAEDDLTVRDGYGKIVQFVYGEDEVDPFKSNFAEFVTMQGGVVLFTGEFEAYLNAKLGRRTNFMKMFKAWWTQKQAEKTEDISEDEFTRLLLDHLSDKKGSSSEGRPIPIRCTENSDDTA